MKINNLYCRVWPPNSQTVGCGEQLVQSIGELAPYPATTANRLN